MMFALVADILIVGSLVSTARMRRYHRHCACGLDGEEIAAVVTTISNDVGWPKAVDALPLAVPLRLRHVVGLSRCDDQAQRAIPTITSHVDFGAQTSSGTPQSLCRGPPFPVAAC